MKLVIVESPTKAKTLSKFLGTDYKIMASMGHIRDLPKSRLSVDTEHDFTPNYELMAGKEKIIKELLAASKKASQIIVASDPDREGEAIAYHVAYILSAPTEVIKNLLKTSGIKLNKKTKGAKPAVFVKDHFAPPEKFVRITFHEITKEAIEEALKHPGKINMTLMEAQQARRILDRLVGYKLSPLLWSKVRRGLSAGRVQSVALRLIVEREKEIANFKKGEFWTIDTELLSAVAHDHFIASLYSKDGIKYEETKTLELFAGNYKYQTSSIKDKQQAEIIVKDLQKQEFVIESVEEKEVKRQPGPPFITSTLQQAANNAFGYSGKKTMMLAQRLYEEGYITYHRTDSFALAQSAINQFRGYIKTEFGEKYLSPEPRVYKTHSKSAQEAHEAIRPTNVKKTNKEIENELGPSEAKLYQIIFKRAVATQMAAAVLSQTAVTIKAGSYLLKTSGLRTLFDGFLKLYPGRARERFLPKLEKDQKLNLEKVNPLQNFATPPPRYNEASLVKILEAKGIGRPSTYAPIISLIQLRGYVEKKEGAFWPTVVGDAVIKFLLVDFDEIINIPFTAEMEEDLDAIARGEKKWVPVLARFWKPFEKKVKEVAKTAQRVKIEVEKTGKKCPKCTTGDVVIRTGRFGKFLSCSRFPECDWKDTYQEKISGIKCPDCGGEVVLRRSRKGRIFYGCSKWPVCKWASWRKPGKENSDLKK